MLLTDDTIVAIATPLGRGGIGVVRLSGPKPSGSPRADGARSPLSRVARPSPPCRRRVERQPGSRAPPTVIRRSRPGRRDAFPAPQSYTGEDVAEISAHGSPVVLQAFCARRSTAGARLAEPGEFTLRAFLHGKLDSVQAEAVADLIDAVTPLQARAAFDQLEGTLTTAIAAIEASLFDLIARLEASLDFPDEGYHFIEPAAVAREIASASGRTIEALLAQAARGRLIREGAQIAIVGTPNVGKSSLFNALLNANRAIVTPMPGTTRDLLTERADIGGMSVALVDTAGIRDTADDRRTGRRGARQAGRRGRRSDARRARSVPRRSTPTITRSWRRRGRADG